MNMLLPAFLLVTLVSAVTSMCEDYFSDCATADNICYKNKYGNTDVYGRTGCRKTCKACNACDTNLPGKQEMGTCEATCKANTVAHGEDGDLCKFDASKKKCCVPAATRNLAAIGKCGVSVAGNKRIVGGKDVTSNKEYPWMAALEKRGRRFCAGSLVSADWVVSAAHCLANYRNGRYSNLKVVLGDLRKSKHDDGQVSKRVSQIIIHDGYYPKLVINDIALIKLDSQVKFTDSITAICLPCSYTNTNFIGKRLTVTGWGQTKMRGNSASTLKEVTVPIVSNTACRRSLRRTRAAAVPVIKMNMCAGGEGVEGSCHGDSGGPAVWSDNDVTYLLGVTSWGLCERAGYADVYTRVTEYIKWIEKTTEQTFCT